MKCSKCENEDMAIVSVTVQDGKDDVFFATIGFMCIGIIFIGIVIFASAFSRDMEFPEENIMNLIMFLATFKVLFIQPAIGAFFCFSFRKLIPYQTHDEIIAVCRSCGHMEKLERK